MLAANDLMKLIGQAMEELSTIIIEENGFIDKYIGDAIMALWNCPVEDSQHQIRACIAAIKCVNKLEELAPKWAEANYPMLKCRIGIHFGTALVGNFGSTNRLNYTAIGDNGKE
jgi:adenylate cyclase